MTFDQYGLGGPADDLRALLNEIRARTSDAGRPMTLDRVVERAGTTSAGYLSDVLKGKRTPNPETAVAFAEAMNARPHEVARVRKLAEQAQAVRSAGAATLRVPHMLKPAPRGFVGRKDDLAVLSALAGVTSRGVPTRTITRVSGVAGVGKSWFVRQWAQQYLAKFPDGQLYADLHGYTDGTEPTAAEEVLKRS